MKNVIIMADGGSRNNPGQAASGFVAFEHEKLDVLKGEITTPGWSTLLKDKKVKSNAIGLGIATNNVAEWTALKIALIWLQDNYSPTNTTVQILMDSNLVIQQIQGNWKVKEPHLKPIYIECKSITDMYPRSEFNHIYREYNSDADALVNQVLDSK
jgi:ribonuclease HI